MDTLYIVVKKMYLKLRSLLKRRSTFLFCIYFCMT